MAERRGRARSLVGLAVALGGLVVGLVVLFLLVDVGAAWAALISANPVWIGVAIALALNATVLVGGKLWAVVRIVDEPRTFRQTWSAVMAGVSLNAVIPGRGGDLVRAVFLSRSAATLPVLLGAVLLERLIDLLTIGVLVLVIAPRFDLITAVAVFVIAAAVGGTTVLAWLGPNVPFRPDRWLRLSLRGLRSTETVVEGTTVGWGCRSAHYGSRGLRSRLNAGAGWA